MMISNVHNAVNLYSAGGLRYSAVKKSGDFKEDFKLSLQAGAFKDMLKKLRNEPEVRQDRVEELTRRIDSGNYDVSAENIAASIISVRF